LSKSVLKKYILFRFIDATNDIFTRRQVKNFLQKLFLATKPRRHKEKMRSIFFALPAGRQVRAFAPLWQTVFFAVKLHQTFFTSLAK
jgi:hypothetical protein